MSREQEIGRVLGTLGVLILVIDGLCDTTAPCTGSDVLTDAEFERLMSMRDQLDRLTTTVSSRR